MEWGGPSEGRTAPNRQPLPPEIRRRGPPPYAPLLLRVRTEDEGLISVQHPRAVGGDAHELEVPVEPLALRDHGDIAVHGDLRLLLTVAAEDVEQDYRMPADLGRRPSAWG